MEGTKVRNITGEDFNTIVLKEHEPVVVDFWAPWCGPCKMIGPIIDDIAEEYDGQVKVCKVNVDEQSKIANEYGVMSIPTVMIFKHGKIVDKVSGAREKADFRQMIESVLK